MGMIQHQFKLKLIVLILSFSALPAGAQSSSARSLVVKCQTVVSQLFNFGSRRSEYRDQALQRMFQTEMLATLEGAKPVSWLIAILPSQKDKIASEGQASLKEAIESNQLTNPNIQWIFKYRQGNQNQFDGYVVNRKAVESLLQDISVQNALGTLRVWKVQTYSYEEVVASFQEAATYWSQRNELNIHAKENLDRTYDFDVLAGLLFGFEPTDVLIWAKSRSGGSLGFRGRTFEFYRDQNFSLGGYTTYQSTPTPGQLRRQEQARLAVSRYLEYRNRGLNNYEIYNQWPTQISDEPTIIFDKAN